MIITSESGNYSPGVIENYGTPIGEVFRASLEEQISDNPTTRIYEFLKSENAGGVKVSKDQALDMARRFGVELSHIPDDGIRSESLTQLIERQYQKKVRRIAIESAEDTIASSAAKVSGSVLGSFLDPLNIGVSFIPFANQAKYAFYVAAAQNPLKRAAIRGGVGAIEGALGSSLLEIPQVLLARELGDEFSYLQIPAHIATGAVIGGAAHIGFGALKDLFGRPIPRGAPTMDRPFEADSYQARVAIGQLVEDRPVNVAPFSEAEKAEIKKQMQALELQINEQKENLKPFLREQLKNLKSELGIEETNVTQVINKGHLQALQASEAQNELKKQLAQAFQEGKEIELRFGDQSVKLSGIQGNEITDAEGGSWTPEELLKALGDENVSLEVRPPGSEAPTISSQDLQKAQQDFLDALEEAKTEPDSFFDNPDLVRNQDAQLKETPQDIELKEAQQLAEDEYKKLEELVNSSHENPEEAKEELKEFMKEGEEAIHKASEAEKAYRLMALCLLRRGMH